MCRRGQSTGPGSDEAWKEIYWTRPCRRAGRVDDGDHQGRMEDRSELLITLKKA